MRKYLNYCFFVLIFLNVSNDVNFNYLFVFVFLGGFFYLVFKINEVKDLFEVFSKVN